MNDFETIQVQDFAQRDRFKRISQRDVLPIAIKGRNISNVIFGSEAETASTTLGNGEQAVLITSLTQNNKYELLAIPFIASYVGTVTSANELPGGASIDESQWQVIGPRYDYATWSSNNFPQHIDYATLFIRNISAGSVTVNFLIKWRYISPREGSV